MATLKLYTDKTVRSHAARTHLQTLGVAFEEVNVEQTASADVFLESQGRNRKRYPLPQYYVGNKLAWANGYKDVAGLTAAQINSKVEELNAS